LDLALDLVAFTSQQDFFDEPSFMPLSLQLDEPVLQLDLSILFEETVAEYPKSLIFLVILSEVVLESSYFTVTTLEDTSAFELVTPAVFFKPLSILPLQVLQVILVCILISLFAAKIITVAKTKNAIESFKKLVNINSPFSKLLKSKNNHSFTNFKAV